MTDYATARRNMVESQVRANDVTDVRLQEAMLRTPRELFTPKAMRCAAYVERDIEVAPGRHLIEARDFAKLADAADVRAGDIVLDIGCGTGYSTAILAALAETVVGLEADAGLTEAASRTLAGLDIANAVVVTGELTRGCPEQGPFDVIFLNGSVAQVPPGLLEQLKEGGRLAAIVQTGPVGKATVFTRGRGQAVGRRVVFDASAPALPEFAAAPVFEF